MEAEMPRLDGTIRLRCMADGSIEPLGAVYWKDPDGRKGHGAALPLYLAESFAHTYWREVEGRVVEVRRVTL